VVVPASGEMVLASAARPVAVSVAAAEDDEQVDVPAADVDDFSSGAGGASLVLAATAVIATSTRRRSNNKLPPLPATPSVSADADAAPAAVSVSASTTDLISSGGGSDTRSDDAGGTSEPASGRPDGGLSLLPLALEGSIGNLAMAAAVTTSGKIAKQKKKEKKDKDKKDKKERKEKDKKDKKSNKKLPPPLPAQAMQTSSSSLSPAAPWTSSSPVVSARGRKKSGQLADQPEFLLELVVHSAAELAAANRNGTAAAAATPSLSHCTGA
jgi:hypothetical protein